MVDLRRYYELDIADIIACEGPSPAIVNLLIAGLPDTSLTHALALGGPEHYGWGFDRHLAVSHFEQSVLKRLDGQRKVKFEPVPRPSDPPPKPATLEDVMALF